MGIDLSPESPEIKTRVNVFEASAQKRFSQNTSLENLITLIQKQIGLIQNVNKNIANKLLRKKLEKAFKVPNFKKEKRLVLKTFMNLDILPLSNRRILPSYRNVPKFWNVSRQIRIKQFLHVFKTIITSYLQMLIKICFAVFYTFHKENLDADAVTLLIFYCLYKKNEKKTD